MLGSIYIGFEHLDQTRASWQRDALFREKVRSAFLMREAIRERSFHLTFATTMDDFFDRDEQRGLYNAKAVDFLMARDKLIELHMTPPETHAMEALINKIIEARPIIDSAMNLVVEKGNVEEALAPMRVALDGQSGVIDQINSFIAVVEEESLHEAQAATRAISTTQRNMLVLSGCAVALAALIGIMVLVREIRQTQRLRRHRDELASLSTTDALTDLANRRRFDEFLGIEWLRAMRTEMPLSLILMDIDHFKLYNDEYGHAAGDICLQNVSLGMSKVIGRVTDLLARYGGEEFACILPDTPPGAAHDIAEKLRAKVEALNLKHEKSSVADHVTISIGVATIVPSPDSALPQLFAMADANLYKAKEEGRNRVVAG